MNLQPALPAYAELHVLSSYSFQRGASTPGELVRRAHALGYSGLAMTDEASVSGVVQAWEAARELPGFQLMLGSVFALEDEAPADTATSAPTSASPGKADDGDRRWRLVVLACNRDGWGNLCEFITAARRAAPKGQYHVAPGKSDLGLLQACVALLLPPEGMSFVAPMPTEPAPAALAWVQRHLAGRLWLGVERLLVPDDALRLQQLQAWGAAHGVPLVAVGGAVMHARSRKPLHDVMTAIAQGQPVSACGFALQANAERHLRSRLRLARLYPPELLRNTLAVAAHCRFQLDEIRYHYPLENVLPGLTPAQTLARLTHEGAATRYPQGVPPAVQQQLARELGLIADCGYEMYFLTVHDIVRHARSLGILCQGRGSAANSAVCYCLGITAVDPARSHLLFERFISRERREPPDIDVDFEHERREEVIQYIYTKYGHDRAALAAVVITYRGRSAVRDVGKALNVPAALVDVVARDLVWLSPDALPPERLHELMARAGVVLSATHVALWLALTRQLHGMPRHLSQHVGGFVLTEGKLSRLVPIENAAMKDRRVIQWEKDDLEALGLMKVDILALGMLSAIRKCLDLVNQCRARWPGTGPHPLGRLELHNIPAEDPATYAMMQAADTVGVFQIESRAQMSMLPRLKPVTFYDVVVQVAIVRPGPIQGGMVHPYLRRRQGTEPEEYAKPDLRPALERTLGVPIFQEQVMQIAMIAAGFSAEMADRLRRSMAAWKRKGGVHAFRQPLVDGMRERGYPQEFAERIFEQILGFGEYGFPESHAYSFALLAYASAWLKCHEPACFLVALINSLPMGFYSPSQLVQDARRHGVVVRAADVSHSDWDCTLEPLDETATPIGAAMPGSGTAKGQGAPIAGLPGTPAVRLGLRLVAGLSHAGAQALVQARVQGGAFADAEDLALRAGLGRVDLDALAAADALASLAGHRRQQVWQATGLAPAGQPIPRLRSADAPARAGLLHAVPTHEAALDLPPAPEGEEVTFDYAALGLTLRRHPLALLRPQLATLRLQRAQDLRDLPDGCPVRGCGLVTVRQRPQTANGTVFVTLEDETGNVNVIVWKDLRERQRDVLLQARLLAVYGIWQRDVDSGGEVRHLVARQLRDLTPLLGRLGQTLDSRDFH